MKRFVTTIMLSVLLLPSAALAVSANSSTVIISTLKTRGDAEISRRLTSLNTVASAINSAPKLSLSDKSTLSNQVSNEISGLNTLKSKLDSDTDITDVRADVQSIITDYRVYALILPKVRILVAADRVSVASTTLSDLVTKLSAKIAADQAAGKDVSTMSTQLTQMQTDITNANSIYTSVHDSIINLQPTDYNSDHAILEGKRTQLVQAASDLKDAVTNAKSIISELKAL